MTILTVVATGLPPIQTSPEEVSTLEDELMRELHETRANIIREHGGDAHKLDTYFESLNTYGIPGRIFQTKAC